MFPHLLIGGMVYSLTVGPWGYLCLKLKWSAFRVFAVWQLVTVGLLMPLLNCAAFSQQCWYLYNVLTWPARCITVITFGAVAGELLERLELGLTAGGLLGLAMIIGLGHDWIATAYRIAGLATALTAAYAMRRYPEKRTLAAGLLVFALVPAISEMPSVLEYGGWLRLVPTVSAWIAFAIWKATADTTLGNSVLRSEPPHQ